MGLDQVYDLGHLTLIEAHAGHTEKTIGTLILGPNCLTQFFGSLIHRRDFVAGSRRRDNLDRPQGEQKFQLGFIALGALRQTRDQAQTFR